MTPATPKTGNAQKYVALANLLRGQIEGELLKPHDRLPSVVDLRQMYGASQATAERAYALLERDGLIVRKPNRGVYVADWRQARRQCVMGIAIPSAPQAHGYYERIVRGIQSVAHEEQLDLLFFHENSPIRWEKVDGVLLAMAARANLENLPLGMPAVSLLNPLRSGASVVSDDREAVRLLVRHLLSLGHRRIGYFTTGMLPYMQADIFFPDITGGQRLEGYYEAMRDAGVEPEASWVRPIRDNNEPMREFEDLGRSAMSQWLMGEWSQSGCTAILAHNDNMAIGIIEVLQTAGLRVPVDVSVVGFDGLDIADYYRPRLTTIQVPLEEIGARGARLLLEKIRMPLSALNASSRTELESLRVDLVATLKIGDSSGPSPS